MSRARAGEKTDPARAVRWGRETVRGDIGPIARILSRNETLIQGPSFLGEKAKNTVPTERNASNLVDVDDRRPAMFELRWLNCSFRRYFVSMVLQSESPEIAVSSLHKRRNISHFFLKNKRISTAPHRHPGRTGGMGGNGSRDQRR
jgi:hypothetical protein